MIHVGDKTNELISKRISFGNTSVDIAITDKWNKNQAQCLFQFHRKKPILTNDNLKIEFETMLEDHFGSEGNRVIVATPERRLKYEEGTIYVIVSYETHELRIFRHLRRCANV